jgi:hypothetical protein
MNTRNHTRIGVTVAALLAVLSPAPARADGRGCHYRQSYCQPAPRCIYVRPACGSYYQPRYFARPSYGYNPYAYSRSDVFASPRYTYSSPQYSQGYYAPHAYGGHNVPVVRFWFPR